MLLETVMLANSHVLGESVGFTDVFDPPTAVLVLGVIRIISVGA